MLYRFSFRRFSLSFKTAVRTAHGYWSHRDGVLLRVTDAKGNSGFGEAAPIPWFGTETIEEVEAACRALGETIAREPTLPTKLVCLSAAWRSAMADLKRRSPGKAPAEKPAVDLRPYLSVSALLPSGRAALQTLESRGADGFRNFKWKVGMGRAADERSMLDDVLAALPTGSKLRLDANGAWDSREADRWLSACANRPIEFVEQPVSADLPNVEDVLLGLAGHFPTPIALDESVATGFNVERWLDLGWRGPFVIKPTLVANLDFVLARLAKANVPVVFSSALETVVGAEAALRRAFAFPGEPAAIGFGVYPLFQDRRFDGPHLAPFIRREDLERLDAEAAWNALS